MASQSRGDDHLLRPADLVLFGAAFGAFLGVIVTSALLGSLAGSLVGVAVALLGAAAGATLVLPTAVRLGSDTDALPGQQRRRPTRHDGGS